MPIYIKYKIQKKNRILKIFSQIGNTISNNATETIYKCKISWINLRFFNITKGK